MRLIGVLILLAGCHIGSVAGPDASGEPGLGMFVNWNAKPMLPGRLTDKLTVSEATFQLDHFQVLSDFGAAATTHAKYALTWGNDAVPQQEKFPNAPATTYSLISLVLMSASFGQNAYEIHGTWQDNGTTMPRRFVVRDQGSLAIEFGCNAMLPAAGSATIAIKVDLRNALSEIDFTSLDDGGDDTLELYGGKELDNFRGRLMKAFKLDN